MDTNTQTPTSNTTNVTVNNNGGSNLARDLFYLTATGILAVGAIDVVQNGPENSVTGRLIHGTKDTTVNQITIKNNIPRQAGSVSEKELHRQLEQQHLSDSLKMIQNPVADNANPDTTALFYQNNVVPIKGVTVDTPGTAKPDTLKLK